MAQNRQEPGKQITRLHPTEGVENVEVPIGVSEDFVAWSIKALNEGNYDIGSKDKDYPGYFVVYEGFISIYGRINFLLEKLEFMNKEIKDTLHLPLLDEEQLHSLKKHSKELE